MGSNEVKFNDGQIKAIDAPHTEPIVVTAAAGSGKTLILVNRVIRLLCDRSLNISADTLAIMTFTRNATKSLHQKLNKAISKKLADDSLSQEDKDYLSEQMFKLRQANISTIDAFCLKVIKENPEAFGLPVNFTIADSAKQATMQAKAIQLAMQAFYSDSNTDPEHSFTKEERTALFYTFNFENDRALQEQVINFANELSSYADADKYMSEALALYEEEKLLEKQYLNVFQSSLDPLVSKAESLLSEYSETLDNIESEGKSLLDDKKKSAGAKTLLDEVLPDISVYAELDKARFSSAITSYKNFLSSQSIATLGDFFARVRQFPEMPKISTKGTKVPSRTQFTALKNKLQKIADALKNGSFDPENSDLNRQRLVISTFVKLTKIYNASLDFIKKTQGCIDFSDCELLLLNKLRDDETFRNELSSRFSCIIVDEFQDSNDIQAEIFKAITSNCLFYVGDIKQSIYAFRGGNPYIMAALCDGKDGFKPLKLNYNYRSRNAIIETVNAAFSGLMTREYGGVDYDTDLNRLKFGAEFYPALPEEHKSLYSTDIFLLNNPYKEEYDKEMYQARFVARKIKELHDNEEFKITRNGEFVRPKYSDFMVLVRTRSPIPAYRKALSELGIASSAPKGRNFLESEEVNLILNYLAIVDNPLKDEEMLKVLMSPIYRISANEVAEIRLGLTGLPADSLNEQQKKAVAKQMRKYSLYNCLRNCTKPLNLGEYIEGETTVIERSPMPKLIDFMSYLDTFRYFRSSNSLYNLVCRIYEDTDAENIVAVFEDSAQRVANIRQLQSMAADFEKTDGGSLGDFLRFIERVKQNQSQKVEDASRPEEAAQAVQIMTFHASKGLESPVCILTELEGTLSVRDYSGTMLTNRDNYFALMDVDVKRRKKSKTFAYTALERLNRKRACGEELRLLYVALTRAQEKLIMVGKGKLEEWSENILDVAHPESVFESSTPFKWIFSSLMRYFPTTSDCKANFMLNGLNCRVVPEAFDGAPPTISENDQQTQSYEISDKEITLLQNKINYRYPYEVDTIRQEKFSVTELAHRNSTMPINLKKPCFDEDKKQLSGADKGNAYHNCMEHIPFEPFRNADTAEFAEIAEREINALLQSGKLSSAEVEVIEPQKIAEFFSDELGKRMLNSSRTEREYPFFAKVDGREIGEPDLAEFMLQGRIDLFFVENGDIIVVDYKSDNPHNLEKERENYAKQVKIYSAVLPKITGLNVKEIYLYPFMTGKKLKIQ